MSQIILDPIYGTVELDTWAEELVRLPELSSERRRLERIKNLGLIHISFPSATHSKWEHHVGMFHLARQLHLPKEEKRRLEILCLLGGIGHLPFSFPTEEAVLLAAKLSSVFKRSLIKMLEEVRNTCEAPTPDESRLRVLHSVEDVQREDLHAWLTALKLKRLPRSIDLGDRSELVYERLNLRGDLNKLYRFLSRLDYVQRDLYYTGLAKFSLSAEAFLRRYKASTKELGGTPEALLLGELRSYLADSLYFENRCVSREALYSKWMASILADEAVTLRDLLAWNDAELETEIERRGGGGWWAQLARDEFTKICSAKIPQSRRRFLEGVSARILDVEADLLGVRKNVARFLTTYPDANKFIVVPRRSSGPREGRASIDVFVTAIGKPTHCRPIVNAVWKLATVHPVGGSVWSTRWQNLGQDLLGYLLNATVRAGYREMAEICAFGFSGLTNKEKRRFIRKLNRSLFEFFLYAGNMLEADAWEDIIKTPLFSGFLGKEDKALAEILASAVRHGREFTRVVEALIWTHEQHELRSVEAKWVLPNVTVEGKNGVNQVDAISLFVQGRKVVIRFHECTKSDSEGKALDDFEKLEKIKSGAKIFDDLSVQQFVYGASSLREHFSPLQSLLDKYKIREGSRS